jgi:hypothetical protein
MKTSLELLKQAQAEEQGHELNIPKETFSEKLQVGLLGEDLISRWLRSYGWHVLPAYEVSLDTGKGPRLFTAHGGKMVSPDLLIFQGKEIRWAEAKFKRAFTWHRISNSWQTGIDKYMFKEYLSVREATEFQVYLFFLHEPGHAAVDTPEGAVSPSGLYGQSIDILKNKIDHESDRHGPSGMVYWREKDLRKFCEYKEITRINNV